MKFAGALLIFLAMVILFAPEQTGPTRIGDLELSPSKTKIVGKPVSVATAQFKLTNKGSETLTLVAQPTCGCQSVVLSQPSLRPGESSQVVINYDPAQLPPGDYSKVVNVQATSKNSSFTVNLITVFTNP